MTEPKSKKAASPTKPAPKANPKRTTRKGAVAAVASLAGAATIAAFGGLWLQMANGSDPVLAAGQQVEAQRPTVIKKIVVVRKVAADGGSGYSSTSGYSGSYSSSSGYSGGSSSSGGGSVAAAPAPAPVVSSAS